MLCLPIKMKWLEMIASGEKKDEYREIKPYWTTRFKNVFPFDGDNPIPGHIVNIMLKEGYDINSPSLVVSVSLSIGTGREDWGAVKGELYYKLHIESIETEVNGICSPLRVLICGSRNFDESQIDESFNLVTVGAVMDSVINSKINECVLPSYPVEIVEGGARGADIYGRGFANRYGYQLTEMLADWSIGKQAGYIRNVKMFEYLAEVKRNMVFILWDGESKGTLHDIKLSYKYGMLTYVYLYRQGVWLTPDMYLDIVLNK